MRLIGRRKPIPVLHFHLVEWLCCLILFSITLSWFPIKSIKSNWFVFIFEKYSPVRWQSGTGRLLSPRLTMMVVADKDIQKSQDGGTTWVFFCCLYLLFVFVLICICICIWKAGHPLTVWHRTVAISEIDYDGGGRQRYREKPGWGHLQVFLLVAVSLIVTYKYKNKHKHKLVCEAEISISFLHRQGEVQFYNFYALIIFPSNFCKVLLHLTLVIKQNMYWCNIAEGKTMKVEATGF